MRFDDKAASSRGARGHLDAEGFAVEEPLVAVFDDIEGHLIEGCIAGNVFSAQVIATERDPCQSFSWNLYEPQGCALGLVTAFMLHIPAGRARWTWV